MAQLDGVANRRFAAACGLGAGAAFVVFFWFLWAAPGGFLDPTPWGLGAFYDEQTRAWFDGRWDADAGSFFIERINIDGRYYMYFGPWPALLRVPVLAVTSYFDGRLTRISLLAALAVLLVGASRLVWQARTLYREGRPTRREQAALAAFVFALGCGSSVLILSASIWVYDEAILWGAAWAVWSLCWCIAHLTAADSRTLALASATTTLAILSRPSSGVIGVAVLGGVFAVQMLGTVVPAPLRRLAPRVRRLAGVGGRLVERRPWPTAVAAAVPVAAYAAVNLAKFGSAFSVPFDRQDLVNDTNPLRRGVLEANGSDLLAIDEIPTNVLNYFRPDGISFHRLFPFIDFKDGVAVVGSPARDIEWLYASLTVTATFLLALTLVGFAAVYMPRSGASLGSTRVRVLRLPALATIAGLVPTLMFPSVFQRYTVDFTPAFVLLGATGLCATLEHLRGRVRLRRVAVAVGVVVLAWNVAANIALTLNLQRGYGISASPADRGDWLRTRIRWTERLGLEPSVVIIRWDRRRSAMPSAGPIGSVLVADRCASLMLSDGSTWLPVEMGDPSSLCEESPDASASGARGRLQLTRDVPR